MTEDEIRKYMGRTYSIDCQRMVLTQNVESPPRVYEGPGSIYQTAAGDLEFKLYDGSGRDSTVLNRIVGPQAVKAGEILPKEKYFSLEATAVSGGEWRGDFILPDFRQGAGDYGPVVTGSLWNVVKAIGIPHGREPGSFLTLRFADAFEFPGNTAKTTRVFWGNQEIQSSGEWTTAKFKAAGRDFSIHEDDSCVVLSVNSAVTPMPERLEASICDALQFTVFKSLPWVVSSAYGDRMFTTMLRPFPKRRGKENPQPPINFASRLIVSEVWSLFAKYLEYIIGDARSEGHPLSAAVRAAVEGQAGYLEPGLLVLSVAVESALNTGFPDLGLPDESARKQIEAACRLVSRSDLDASFKSRVAGALNAMYAARAKDKLMALAEAGLIRAELIQSWESIRHPSAHGARVNQAEIHRLYRDYQATQTLFNELVFLTIGYTGKYTDYSMPGWPLRDFDKQIHKRQPEGKKS